MRHDRIGQVKALGVAAVAKALGFELDRRGERSSAVRGCPACRQTTRHQKSHDRRGAVGLTPNGMGWRCFQCDVSGSALDFASWASTGRRLSRDVMPAVLRACANAGLCDDLARAASGWPVTRRPPVAQPIEPPRLERPPAGEVAALWAASYRLDAVPSDINPAWGGEARAYLGRRRYDVGIAARLDLARVLPPPTRFAWPSWWTYDSKTWRVVMPLFDASGALVSLQARAIIDATPKDRNARGYAMGELAFACPLGRAFLAGDVVGIKTVTVVEGLTDVFRLTTHMWLKGDGHAVLGVVSGSAPMFSRIAWPVGVPCWVATDNDAQGDRYADAIVHAIPEHVQCERIAWGGRREVQS